MQPFPTAARRFAVVSHNVVFFDKFSILPGKKRIPRQKNTRKGGNGSDFTPRRGIFGGPEA